MANLNSMTIELAVYYCGNEFEKCAIYQKQMLIERLRDIERRGTSASGPETPAGPSAPDPSDNAEFPEKGGIRCGGKS